MKTQNHKTVFHEELDVNQPSLNALQILIRRPHFSLAIPLKSFNRSDTISASASESEKPSEPSISKFFGR